MVACNYLLIMFRDLEKWRMPKGQAILSTCMTLYDICVRVSISPIDYQLMIRWASLKDKLIQQKIIEQ